MTDRRAVVTGASSGIGRAVALKLASEGLAVTGIGRSRERLDDVARAGEGRIDVLVADLGAAVGQETLAAELASHDPVDILIHCAGAFAYATVAGTTPEIVDECLYVNVRAPFVITSALLPVIRARRGDIVFVNSTVLSGPGTNVAAYAASKHALKSLADSLRAEVSGDGVRVVSVYPGRTATPMQERVCAAEGSRYDPRTLLAPSEVADLIWAVLEMERSGEVIDITVRPLR
jgi:short-subunit dehydrogenase